MDKQELIKKAEIVIEKTPPNALKPHWREAVNRLKLGDNSQKDIDLLETSLRFL